jgi:hypothetical protein
VHRPFGQQLEDRSADVAALAASPPAATTATWTAWAAEAESESATGIEAELEAAARTEAATRTKAGPAREAGAPVVFAQMITKVITELAAGLSALLMKRAAIAGAEAKAESAGGWGKWVGHI